MRRGISMRKLQNILVTGGAGFIGSNFIRLLFNQADFDGRVINLDALTYAGNFKNLIDISTKFNNKRYFFIHGNITDVNLVNTVFSEYKIDTVVHFAAESHVDRSILEPDIFLKTNILGTNTLLNVAKNHWLKKDNSDDYLFHHISTDEVYGSLGNSGAFFETTAYAPRSPYSASKAASDHLVRAYHHTYGLPVTVSNCSNNYGPFQFPEKFIPLIILNILEKKEIPIYGDGKQIRDWIYVDDHNSAILKILLNGKTGATYNIGGENEWENIKLVNKLIEIMCKKLSLNIDDVISSIRHIVDRPGHDRRYAIDCSKIKKELGWKQSFNFDEGLEATVDWYLKNEEWIHSIKSGEYQNWIQKNYESR